MRSNQTVTRRRCLTHCRPLPKTSANSSTGLALLVHRLHHGTDDPSKDRTTARAA